SASCPLCSAMSGEVFDAGDCANAIAPEPSNVRARTNMVRSDGERNTMNGCALDYIQRSWLPMCYDIWPYSLQHLAAHRFNAWKSLAERFFRCRALPHLAPRRTRFAPRNRRMIFPSVAGWLPTRCDPSTTFFPRTIG